MRDGEDVTLVLCDLDEPHDRDACDGCLIERQPCQHTAVTHSAAGRNAA